MPKIDKNSIIPYNRYYIDSARFLIDTNCFDEVNVNKQLIAVDSDTGEEVDYNFKPYSLEIKHKGHTIYICKVIKKLPNGIAYDKIQIYFPAKVGNSYFKGIQRNDYIDVLNIIKDKGYIKGDTIKLLKNTFVKDLDIKCDYEFDYENHYPKIKQYNQDLKNRYNGYANEFHLFDSKKNGFGLSTGKRETATLTRPFLKFYDKSKEMAQPKNYDIYKSLSKEEKREIDYKFVYRFEMTLKNKAFFDKYGISNNLEDIFEVRQEKWNEIAKDFMNLCFQPKIREPRDKTKLNVIEKMLFSSIERDIQKKMPLNDIKSFYLYYAENKVQRHRMSQKFDRIYWFIVNPSEQTIKMKESHKNIVYWDNFFGIG